jgi:O-antigen ligase
MTHLTHAQVINNRYDYLISFLFFSIPAIKVGGEVLFGIISLYGILCLFKGDGRNWHKTTFLLVIALASIFFIKLISVSWALYPYATFKNALLHIHFLAWPLCLVVFLRANNPLLSMLKGVIFCTYFVAIWATVWLIYRLIYQMPLDSPPFEAGAQNSGVFAQIMVVYVFWIMCSLIQYNRFGSQIHLLISRRNLILALFASLLCLLVSTRRIPMIILFIGLLPVLWIAQKQLTSYWRWIISISTIASAFLLAGLMLPKYQQAYTEAMAFFEASPPTGAIIQSSIGNRLEYFYVAMKAFVSQPILGFGAGISPIKLNSFSHDPQAMSSYNHFHNQYMQSLVEVGILGSLLALVSVMYIVKKQICPMKKNHSEELPYLGILFFVFILEGMMSAAFSQGLLNTFFVAANVCIWTAHLKSQSNE